MSRSASKSATAEANSIFSMYSALEREDTALNGRSADNSLSEVFGSVPVVRGENVPMWKTWSTFFGPGAMIAVGSVTTFFNDI
jgi:hypothetical protein